MLINKERKSKRWTTGSQKDSWPPLFFLLMSRDDDVRPNSFLNSSPPSPTPPPQQGCRKPSGSWGPDAATSNTHPSSVPSLHHPQGPKAGHDPSTSTPGGRIFLWQPNPTDSCSSYQFLGDPDLTGPSSREITRFLYIEYWSCHNRGCKIGERKIYETGCGNLYVDGQNITSRHPKTQEPPVKPLGSVVWRKGLS